MLATWPIAGIVARDRPDRSGIVTLSYGEAQARLLTQDPALLHALAKAVSDCCRRGSGARGTG
ncbi:MAG TPA: hypothetical protein VFE41_13005 [Acetobacteraceae bacterium]|nr:hypothetical protein [Acetobacteraceae bacterium]